MEPDNVLLNVQLPRSVKTDFRIAAKLRGASMSALVFQYIVKVIREEKERFPMKFPDYYDPQPQLVSEESEIDRLILEAAYEAFDGKQVDPVLLKSMMKAIKPLLEVRDHSERNRKVDQE